MDVTTIRRVGKSGLEVMPLGFGAGTIGAPPPLVSNADAQATVVAAWETGVRFYDTAPWYGIGRSERRLGLALAEMGDRDAYQVNTKIGKTLVPEPVREEERTTASPMGRVRTPRDPNSGFRVDFSYTHDRVLAQHQDSLQRLGHSAVDSLTIHDIDYGYHSLEQVDEYLRQLARDDGGGAIALEDLRAGGSIRAIGCGCNLESGNAASWDGPAHEDLCERIADIVDLDFFIVAGGYTLLETRALRRILPLCEQRGIGVIIAAPYASGWLATEDPEATYMYAPAPADVIERSARMRDVCARYGVSLAAAALQFPLAHPQVAAVIPGAKTPEESEQSYARLQIEIPLALWSDLKSEGLLDLEAPTPD